VCVCVCVCVCVLCCVQLGFSLEVSLGFSLGLILEYITTGKQHKKCQKSYTRKGKVVSHDGFKNALF
jgi:hypothetical protein